MATAEAWLGIDLGTQSVRAVLVDDDGDVVGTGRCPLSRDRRDGPLHEQDPDEWWSATCAATRAALSASGGRSVGAVSIDSTSGTLVVQTDDGEPVGPGLMYDDARGAAEAELCRSSGADVWERLGYRMQDTWALPKLVWLSRHGEQPAGWRVAHQGDHVGARLSGHRVATDVSHVLKSRLRPGRSCAGPSRCSSGWDSTLPCCRTWWPAARRSRRSRPPAPRRPASRPAPPCVRA